MRKFIPFLLLLFLLTGCTAPAESEATYRQISMDAAITMIKKMRKKVLPRIIMTCSFVVMLLINIFSWNFSSISMLVVAALVSLLYFVLQDKKKEGKAE